MRALALFSGGCDSLISMKLLTMQGIEVIALHFNIGFGSNKDKREYLRNASAQAGARLEVVDIREQFFNEILFAPKYGYGKYFNPCIDCHANMFANAFYLLEKFGASFVVSGEVLGQRPKSQRKEALDQVRSLVREVGKKAIFDKILDRSGGDKNKPQNLDELLLRPMSAKLLPPSFPEKAGWIDREKLLDISGRGRTRQLEMVQKWGWKYYENPGGGCLLTDVSVAKKLKDLSNHRKMGLQDSTIVKIGRYMVLPNGARAIIGRNESENAKLDMPNPAMEKIILLESIGPLGLVEKDASKEDKILAARITLGYAKGTKSYETNTQSQEASLELMQQTKQNMQSQEVDFGLFGLARKSQENIESKEIVLELARKSKKNIESSLEKTESYLAQTKSCLTQTKTDLGKTKYDLAQTESCLAQAQNPQPQKVQVGNQIYEILPYPKEKAHKFLLLQ